MGNNPPAYQYYAADFNGDTATWTIEEVGIYQRLLNYEWVNGWKPGEGLPDDPKRLCQIARCNTKKFSKSWPIISKKFSANGEGFLVNRRLEEEREIQREFRKKQSESGLRGVETKKKRGIFPFDKSTDPSSKPSTNPSTNPASRNQALHSSSSLKEDSLRKEDFELPSQEEISESSIPKIKLDLDKICEHLYENKIFPKVHAFTNKMLKEKKSERAILHTLVRCALKKEFKTTPWAFCIKIMGVEDGNYNEYEFRKDKG